MMRKSTPNVFNLKSQCHESARTSWWKALCSSLLAAEMIWSTIIIQSLEIVLIWLYNVLYMNMKLKTNRISSLDDQTINCNCWQLVHAANTKYSEVSKHAWLEIQQEYPIRMRPAFPNSIWTGFVHPWTLLGPGWIWKRMHHSEIE